MRMKTRKYNEYVVGISPVEQILNGNFASRNGCSANIFAEQSFLGAKFPLNICSMEHLLPELLLPDRKFSGMKVPLV